MIVVLVRIHSRVVHAHISDKAADQQRIHTEPTQKEIKIRGKEAAVTTLWDNEIAIARLRLRTKGYPMGSFDAVDSLVAVQFPSEIDALLSMSFLRELIYRPLLAGCRYIRRVPSSRLLCAGEQDAGHVGASHCQQNAEQHDGNGGEGNAGSLAFG